MTVAFDRTAQLQAFDRIGRAAVAAGSRRQIAVHGGSARMLAGHFRVGAQELDLSELARPRPAWLATRARQIGDENGWPDRRCNNRLVIHLGPPADRDLDHLQVGIFPCDGSPPRSVVSVRSAQCPPAPKLKALQISVPMPGEAERLDILNLMDVLGISTVDDAIAAFGRYFPLGAASSKKRRLLPKNMMLPEVSTRPNMLADAAGRRPAGLARDVGPARCVDRFDLFDLFDLAGTDRDRCAAIALEPKPTGDARLDAPVGAIAAYLARRRLGRVPASASGPAHRPSRPWFASGSPSPGLGDCLTCASPGVFALRNIFTKERSLRRARALRPVERQAR